MNPGEQYPLDYYQVQTFLTYHSRPETSKQKLHSIKQRLACI